MVVALRPCRVLLEGSIDVDIVTDPENPFDPGNMTFAREDENDEIDGNNNKSVWDNAW